MQTEIDQIKETYNAKLKAAMESDKPGREEMIIQFEKALNLEFDKILLSLKMKTTNLTQEQLNQRRQDINTSI